MDEMQLSLLDLLLLPVSLPVRGFVLLLEQVRSAADRELYDPDTVGRNLVEQQLRYEMGEIGEPDYRWALSQLSARRRANGG